MKTSKRTIVIGSVLFLAGILLGWALSGGSENVIHEHEQAEEAIIYTCSMHPQVQQDEAGDCPLCGMDLVPANSLAEDGGLVGLQLSENELILADVRTLRLRPNNTIASSKISWNGELRVNDQLSQTQSAHVSGRIEKAYVYYEGQTIARTQPVAEIYNAEWIQLQQELLWALKNQERDPAPVEALLQKIKRWKVSDQDLRTLLSEQKVMETYTLRAEHSGLVETVYLKEGDYLKEGAAVYASNSYASLWTVLDARPQDLDKLKLGSKLDVKVEGWDEEYTATVDFIPQRIETGNQRIAIRATLDNAGTKLQAGLSLRASLAESSATKDKLWIPERSVLWTGERSLVYKKENDRFLPTEVVLGEQSGGYWQVKSGLVLGDEIAVSGVFNLDAAAQLMGLESMMNRQPSIYSGVQIKNESLAELLAAYWPLSEALVASDTEKGRLAAQRLSRVLSQLFADDQDDLPLRHYAEAMASSATDIKQQRKDFESFSADLYALIKAQDPEQLQLPSTLYWQYCPMAFDDQGAYWLSNQPDILNPYFGDMMLRCGETREEL